MLDRAEVLGCSGVSASLADTLSANVGRLRAYRLQIGMALPHTVSRLPARRWAKLLCSVLFRQRHDHLCRTEDLVSTRGAA